MTYQITQAVLTPELKLHIYDLFSQHSTSVTGIDGMAEKPIVFELRDDHMFIGCIVVEIFWGQLHIKYLIVEEAYRNQGHARRLMNHAFEFGKQRGCSFAFVETLSFQALDFYKKLGFIVELSRAGYMLGVSFYYLRKDLNENDDYPIEIKQFSESDIQLIVDSFERANWPKPASIFEAYLKEQHNDARLLWVAHVDNKFAGYITLKWKSQYGPFATSNIPEIMDLNVLPSFRGLGVGSKLLGHAEKEAAVRADIVGLGVGLYGGPDGGYGAAQGLYIKRGYLPDGKGVTYKYQPVDPGSSCPVDDDLLLWFTRTLKRRI
jgi:ribosomal protein S18 acetylase RimI-like enzyme